MILLYLESFGNPRRFARIARRVSRRKPIVAVKSRPDRGRRAGRVVAHRRPGEHRRGRRRPVPPDRCHPGRHRRRAVRRGAGVRPPAAARAAVAWPSSATPAGRECWPPTPSSPPGSPWPRWPPTPGRPSPPWPIPAPRCSTRSTWWRRRRRRSSRQRWRRRSRTTPSMRCIALATPTYAAPAEEVAATIGRAASGSGKPVVACFLAWPEMPPLLPDDVPAFAAPEPAVRALGRAAQYAEWRRRDPGTVPDLDVDDDTWTVHCGRCTRRTSPPDDGSIPERSTACWARTGSPASSSTSWRPTADEVAAVAERLGYPVVVKAAGPKILHKSDVGGVKLHLASEDDVRAAVAELRAGLGDDLQRVVVQPQVADRCRAHRRRHPRPPVRPARDGRPRRRRGRAARRSPVPGAPRHRRRCRRTDPLAARDAVVVRLPRPARPPTSRRSRMSSSGWPGWPPTFPRSSRSTSTRSSPGPTGPPCSTPGSGWSRRPDRPRSTPATSRRDEDHDSSAAFTAASSSGHGRSLDFLTFCLAAQMRSGSPDRAMSSSGAKSPAAATATLTV